MWVTVHRRNVLSRNEQIHLSLKRIFFSGQYFLFLMQYSALKYICMVPIKKSQILLFLLNSYHFRCFLINVSPIFWVEWVKLHKKSFQKISLWHHCKKHLIYVVKMAMFNHHFLYEAVQGHGTDLYHSIWFCSNF